MVRPADDGSSACALTIAATRARRPPQTVVEISPDATINNRNHINHRGKTHEPPRINSRKNGQGNYNYGSSSNPGSRAPLKLGQDAQNAGNTPPLTVHQPNNGTAPAPASAAGTPGIRYGAANNADNNDPKTRQPRTFRTGSG